MITGAGIDATSEHRIPSAFLHNPFLERTFSPTESHPCNTLTFKSCTS